MANKIRIEKVSVGDLSKISSKSNFGRIVGAEARCSKFVESTGSEKEVKLGFSGFFQMARLEWGGESWT